MNINVESHFSQVPHAEIQRSVFNRSSSHKTSFNVGDLIPVYLDEVLPGDTFKIKTSKVVRLQTLLTPLMDNMYLDTYWFFVPNRLIWSHWQQFCGENTESAWVPETTYTMPKIKSPENGFASGSIADYLGIPVGVEFGADGDQLPTSLPFRAYALICDQWFRDQNLSDPLDIPLGDSTQDGSNGTDYVTDVVNGGMPFKVAKYHDYFTSALPSPQKGDPIAIPIKGFDGGDFPVLSLGDRYNPTVVGAGFPSIKLYHQTGAGAEDAYLYSRAWGESPGSYNYEISHFGDGHQVESSTAEFINFRFNNLYARIPEQESSDVISINDLRLAFAAQRFLERNARGGTRYVEILKSHFGVTSPDARLQRAEYLGGNRVPIQIHQVTNTAQAETDFLGDLGAMSYTADVHSDVDKSFVEHGYIMCVCAVRYDHTYSQGLEKMWTRNLFTDFYLPVFANLGEQPVLKNEIFYDPDNTDVFGYQEAWAEYRYKPNRVSAEMRPDVTNTLASWHLADDYAEAPTLSDGWIREDKTNVDRALAVTSAVSNQVFADFYFDCICARPMPMYSVPGLLDHN